MLLKKYTVILLLLFCVVQGSFSQIIHDTGFPAGVKHDFKSSEYYEFSVSDEKKDIIRNNSGLKDVPLTFAIARLVSLNPDNSGTIRNVSKTKSIWYLKIMSEAAASLNIIFSKYELKKGERVFLYNSDMSSVLGPLTMHNNKPGGILATKPIPGSEIIIEYHFNTVSKGEMEVGKISYDVLGIFGESESKDGFYNTSGPCNKDINCPEGTDWQIEKRAVIRVLAGGTQLGSAVMLNNSNQENLAYALTAQHVIEDQYDAANSVFLFRYESPWCEGPDASNTYSISGSSIIAQNGEVDFSLILLSEFPPLLYKPYLAGWNASSTIATSTVSIHHPSGDVKKISFDYDSPQIESFKQYNPDSFWKVLQWDIGTTEAGSSGAPLFNQDHHVIGHLSGGEAMCGRSVNDYFARFDVAYDLSGNMFKSLRPWLDPAVSGCSYLNGRDPYDENFDLSDTLYNGSRIDYTLTEYSLPGNGYSTGINSDSILAYAEKFTVPAGREITEIFMYVGKTDYVNQSDTVVVSIHSDNDGPAVILSARTISLSSLKDDYLLSIDFGQALAQTGDLWISYTNIYHGSASVETRQYALYKEANQAPGSEYAWFRDKDGWKPFTMHPFDPGEISLAIELVIVENSMVNPVIDINRDKEDINIYPIPFQSDLHIKSGISINQIDLLDIKGNILRQYTLSQQENITITPPHELKPGFYLLKLYSGNSYRVKRIIKTSSR